MAASAQSRRHPLHRAAWKGRTACAERLLSAGAHLDSLDINGRTPLIVAADVGHAACLTALVNAFKGRGLSLDSAKVRAAQLNATTALYRAVNLCLNRVC